MNNQTLIENYRDDERRREQFHAFVAEVFPSVGFRTWHDLGLWADEYVPHSLAVDDRIVANVSATRMSLLIDGRPVPGLQIGTVGTIPEYQGGGLSRRLMEHVIRKYEKEVELIFLFANDEAVQFYPKFGFDRHEESVFVSHRTVIPTRPAARCLDVSDAADLSFLRTRLARRLPISRLFGAEDYAFVTLWYALNIFPRRIFHIAGEDVIAIASERDGALDIYDIVFESAVDPDAVPGALVTGDTVHAVRWHFSPDVVPFHYDGVEPPEDSTFFVRGPFPLRGIPFKFPFTAQT